MAGLEALGLTVRQELVQLDLDQGIVGNRHRIARDEDRHGLVIGLDRRPSDGRVYVLTGLTEMTEHMSLFPLPEGAVDGGAFGERAEEIRLDLPLPVDVLIAFDPVQDNLRAVTPEGRSFRVDPVSGRVAPDGDLTAYDAPGQPRFSAIAYGGDRARSGQAPLYLIDAGQEALYIEDPREPGRLSYIGPLGIALRELSAFRIFAEPEERAIGLLVDGNRIFTLDLLTGQAWDRADFGSEDLVITDMAPL